MKRLLFLTITVFAYGLLGTAQDAQQSAQAPQDETGVKIYNLYKNCVVDVETIMKTEDGIQFSSGGSGFFVDNAGHILTNSHVVKRENDEIVVFDFFGITRYKIVSYTYWVTVTSKNKKYSAELIGLNQYSDLAVLKAAAADSQEYSVAKFGDPDKVKIGERVYAIGMPYRLSNSLTSGTVSGLHRILGMNYLEDFIQTDAPINPGNSGSPLINSQGEVIGINGAKIRNSDGMGFAISVRLVKLEELKKGEAKLPWFGLEALLTNFPRTGTYENPGFQDLKYLNGQTDIDDVPALILLTRLTKDNCAVVNQIDETKDAGGNQSPAKKAGLKRGDLITKVGGRPVQNGMDIRSIILEIPVGKSFEIEHIRTNNGIKQELRTTVTLTEKKEKQ